MRIILLQFHCIFVPRLCFCMGQLHPMEEIHVSELLHLVHIDGLDDLLVVEEYPTRFAFVSNVLPYEGHIVSKSPVSAVSFTCLGHRL